MITRVILDNDIEHGFNKCIICGRNFSASSSRVKYCGQCHIEAQSQTCGNWKKISIYTKNFNNCKKCNAIINAKRNQQPGICTKCGTYSENRNISGLCENCKKDYYAKHNNQINYSRIGIGPCIKCGKILKRNAAGLCKNCQPNNGFGICTKCGQKSENRNAMGFCTQCYNTQLQNTRAKLKSSGICKRCGEFSEIRTVSGLCYICNNEILNKNKLLYIRSNNKITHVLISSNHPLYEKYKKEYIPTNEFLEVSENAEFYGIPGKTSTQKVEEALKLKKKGYEVNEIGQLEYNHHLQLPVNEYLEVSENAEFYGIPGKTSTMKVEKAIKAKKKGMEVNEIGQLEYNHHLQVPVDEYLGVSKNAEFFGIPGEVSTRKIEKAIRAKKKGVEVNEISQLEYNHHLQIPLDEYLENSRIILNQTSMKVFEDIGFEKILTGMTGQGSDGKGILDDLLVKANIFWFVYIVGYIKDKEIHPLKICKSGSLLVNYSGCDVCFWKKDNPDNDDKPSVLFLRKTNSEYYYQEIWIKKCNTEEEAYEEEIKLQKQFPECFG